LCQARTLCSLIRTCMLSPLPVCPTRNGSLQAREAPSATCNEQANPLLTPLRFFYLSLS
jgi:hypothetical protein